jgi:hypothetical protein
MKRVRKERIFIGDLPVRSHRKKHLLLAKDEFQYPETTEGFYNEDQFNVFYDQERMKYI